MVSENKKSNQAAGADYRYCRRSHWLSVLGTLLTLEIPEEWQYNHLSYAAKQAKSVASFLQAALLATHCTCSNCQRRPRRKEDGNPHEGKVML